MTTIGGADGCPGGWVCIERDTITGDIFAEVLPTTREMMERGRCLAVLTVDIPIGLTDAEPRECDREARQLLASKRSSSVFPAPVRAALDAPSYLEACEVSAAACGKRLSKQAHAIMWRIREVDAILRSEPELRARVREIHPEVCFYAWAGHPMEHAKRTPEGRAERLQLVEEHFAGAFHTIRQEIPQKQAADDDILDAFAALWTAERIVRGTASTVPAVPLEDRFGLRMEMVT
jgi:predicted RNase H-like nuclease